MRAWTLGMATLILSLTLPAGWAKTKNGNDFALYYMEARDDVERRELMDEYKGLTLYFRYLLIQEKDEGTKNRYPYINITAFEPASYYQVRFQVTKKVSLDKIRQEPESNVGDAVAIAGRLVGVKDKVIYVNPVIVRHKDRKGHVRGKEMLYEIDASATYYSFTGGKKPISLTYQDRDLLQHQGTFKKKYPGDTWKQPWSEYLIAEVTKRKLDRAKRAKEYEIDRKTGGK